MKPRAAGFHAACVHAELSASNTKRHVYIIENVANGKVGVSSSKVVDVNDAHKAGKRVCRLPVVISFGLCGQSIL